MPQPNPADQPLAFTDTERTAGGIIGLFVGIDGVHRIDLEPSLLDALEEPATDPECPRGHGPMVLRANPDPLAAWCGTWWDCTNGCASSHLNPSDDLNHQLDTMKEIAS